jgi:hypothetical protein
MKTMDTGEPDAVGEHCAYCGLPIPARLAPPERFEERFCSDRHAEEFAAGVRAARMEAAPHRQPAATSSRRGHTMACLVPATGQAGWGDRLKRAACWGAPLLVLLTVLLIWTGGWAAAGGSLPSVVALLACPLGMYFMMRGMTACSTSAGPRSPRGSSPGRRATAVRSALAILSSVTLALTTVGGSAATPGAARPEFEHVHALAFEAAARTLWLGAHTGLYRSDDGGRTWAMVGLPGQGHGVDVMAIAPHPTEAGTLYVGTHDAGVLKTTDGGRTWRAVSAGVGGRDVHGLAIHPDNPDTLHALVREAGAGLYRTTDGGDTWVRVDDGPPGETKVLASVSIPTGMGGIFLYAGTGEGLQRSPDCF